MTFFNQTGIQASERVNNRELLSAFDTARNRKLLARFDNHLLGRSARESMLAVNSHSRILWGKAVSEQIEEHLCDEGEIEHNVPVHFVTLLDINCATSISGEAIDIEKIKTGLRFGLRGISHLGIIEPAYYTNLQVGVRF